MDRNLILHLLGVIVVAAPVALVAVLGIISLIGRKLSESMIGTLVQSAIITGLLTSITILAMMLTSSEPPHVPIQLGNWVHIDSTAAGEGQHSDSTPHPPAGQTSSMQDAPAPGDEVDPPHMTATSYHFSIKFVFDRLSVPFVILTYLLCGTIGAFAYRYMHREPGYNRFFILYSFFLMGMIVASLAGTIETLFVGWELVGLSSAMLVAFFQDRASPVKNGLRVWIVYRISDAALLVASVVMHHLEGHGDFEKFLGHGPWPVGDCAVQGHEALIVGVLLLVAAAGKSALVPFSGWLPRAMEGPTPSSAVFYGALSVHLGAFLLLRLSPLLDASLELRVLIVIVGLVTAVFAAFAGRVQTDVKSSLSFASLTQVGFIVAEIGFGLRYLALIHILGHACFRTLQFVRAPSLLYDFNTMENAIGNYLPRLGGGWDRVIPNSFTTWAYRFALEKGYLDALLADYCVTPILKIFRFCNRVERSWTDLLSGGTTSDEGHVANGGQPKEDILL